MSHIKYQEEYFKEYKLKCQNNPDEMIKELKRWKNADAHILHMTLEEQATYADYVTSKVCLLPEDIVRCLGWEVVLDESEFIKKSTNSCGIGNTALLILTLRKFPNQRNLAQQCQDILEKHKQYVILNFGF